MAQVIPSTSQTQGGPQKGKAGCTNVKCFQALGASIEMEGHFFFFYLRYAGLSPLRPLLPRSTGSGRAGPAATAHGSSRSAEKGPLRTGARTRVLRIGRRTPNHCATREAQEMEGHLNHLTPLLQSKLTKQFRDPLAADIACLLLTVG